MIAIIVGEMGRDAAFDFGDRSFVPVLREEGMPIARDKASWHLPPADTLFVQRKVSGTALLGARLEAVVNVHAIVRETLEANPVLNPSPVIRAKAGIEMTCSIFPPPIFGSPPSWG